MDAPKRRRNWFTFSLRTLFVVVVLVATPLGWIGYQIRWMRAREVGYVRLEEVSPDEFEGTGVPHVPAPWPLPMFGESVVIIRDWPVWLAEYDPEFKCLRELFPELRLRSIPPPPKP